MSAGRTNLLRLALCLVTGLVVLVVGAGGVHAQPKPAETPAVEEARDRFRRGVELYREGDFRNALIEFNRAYAVAPNFRILYNVGQTCMELQDYACAAKSYARYLDEADESIPAGRREEVVETLARVKRRVSKLTITTNASGAEIFVDDVSVGRAPLDSAVTVSAGRRKISVSHPRYLPATRTIDLAGGDTPALRFDLTPLAATTTPERREAPEVAPSRAPFWISAATATVAVAASVTFGVLALDADSDRDKALATFPTTAADIDASRSRASTFAVATDVAAGVAIVATAAAIYFGLRSAGKTKPPKAASAPRVQLGLASLRGEF